MKQSVSNKKTKNKGGGLFSPFFVKFPSLLLEDKKIKILNQNFLPQKIKYVTIKNVQEAYRAIKNMEIRGAPLIGVFAALVVGLEYKKGNDYKKASEILKKTRPTAVNLFKALDRIENAEDPWEEALKLLQEEQENCMKIAELGNRIIKDGATVITYCNTGNLATPGIGSALGIILYAWHMGKKIHVYVPETRPKLQGARLTVFELQNAGIPFTLITDNAIGIITSKIDIALTGADRIASNGDTANKIGTFLLAMACNFHRKPLYIAAPSTTFDLSIKNGKEIEIEERDKDEVIQIKGEKITIKNVTVFNPAFDITPHNLIKGFITEKGIITPPFSKTIKKVIS